ncbi:MAG: hypothetical protein BWY88_01088 [Synergistetes bacterium ADurb.Bin520]|nr:MAG: hypothetical protein BWY88_01088 [Synergistetes bacterium ADurb.Bin520]
MRVKAAFTVSMIPLASVTTMPSWALSMIFSARARSLFANCRGVRSRKRSPIFSCPTGKNRASKWRTPPSNSRSYSKRTRVPPRHAASRARRDRRANSGGRPGISTRGRPRISSGGAKRKKSLPRRRSSTTPSASTRKKASGRADKSDSFRSSDHPLRSDDGEGNAPAGPLVPTTKAPRRPEARITGSTAPLHQRPLARKDTSFP